MEGLRVDSRCRLSSRVWRVSVSRRSLLALGCAALALQFILACGSGSQSVTGIVVDVQAASVVEVRTFSVETANRVRLTFTVRGDAGFTPGHLREHMLSAERVRVTYVREGAELRAIKVEDAP